MQEQLLNPTAPIAQGAIDYGTLRPPPLARADGGTAVCVDDGTVVRVDDGSVGGTDEDPREVWGAEPPTC